VRLADLVTPVAPADGDHRELGKDDSTTDGGGYFLRALHTQADVSVGVTNGYNENKFTFKINKKN
jgi:hypothetical protein